MFDMRLKSFDVNRAAVTFRRKPQKEVLRSMHQAPRYIHQRIDLVQRAGNKQTYVARRLKETHPRTPHLSVLFSVDVLQLRLDGSLSQQAFQLPTL